MMGRANADWNGAFYANVTAIHAVFDGDSIGGGYLYMDASRSSSCYGNYTEVNPLYESTLICIRY